MVGASVIAHRISLRQKGLLLAVTPPPSPSPCLLHLPTALPRNAYHRGALARLLARFAGEPVEVDALLSRAEGDERGAAQMCSTETGEEPGVQRMH